MEKLKEENIDNIEYNSAPRPILLICTLYVLLFGVFIAIEHTTDSFIYSVYAEQNFFAVVFLAYVFLYLAVWLVYFCSVEFSILKVQTLRLLLSLHSMQWSKDMDAEQLEHYYDKGRATITSQAIFIAISVFIISAITEDRSILQFPSTGHTLVNLIGQASLLTAVIAFVLLLLSTDAVETTFNLFNKHDQEITSRFYYYAAKRKYYGFVFSFLAIILFVAVLSTVIGSIGLVLAIFIGYSYWFPDLTSPKKHSNEAYYMLVFMLLIPAALYAYYFQINV